jgi:hypothetical protein
MSISLILQADKTLEDGLLVLRGDSCPIIFDRDAEVHIPTDTDIDSAPAILQGIADQIPEDLLYLLLIMAERGLTVMPGDGDEDPVGLQETSILILILHVTECFHCLGGRNFQDIPNGLLKGALDAEGLLLKQPLFRTGDLYHFLKKRLGFANIPHDTFNDALLMIRKRAIPFLPVKKIGSTG